MKALRLATFVLAAGLSLPAFAWVGPGVTGNDTGGIIPWTAESRLNGRAWAAEHCARYDKFARITSVHPWYGDYISFACDWRPPLRHWTRYRR